MEVTGYQLREAVKQWELKKELCTQEFNTSLHVFEGETKRKPEEIAEEIAQAEKAIAHLQRCQAVYNLVVKCDLDGQPLTLCEAVKLVGGISRQEKLWRTAITGPADPYGYRTQNTNVRSKEQIVASATITEQKAAEFVKTASKKAAHLKATISAANGVKVDIQDLDVQYMNI